MINEQDKQCISKRVERILDIAMNTGEPERRQQLTAELERSEKLLQEERNRAIDDCIEEIQKYFDKADMDTPVLLREMITSKKNED